MATSDTPSGEYGIAVKNATTKYGQGGDFSLFVDDDGRGFLIYTSLQEAHSVSIAPLNAAFTESIPAQNTAFLPCDPPSLVSRLRLISGTGLFLGFNLHSITVLYTKRTQY